MNKTKIEWCDFSVNPVKGYCPVACPYCYARRMYDRFGWDRRIRFNADEICKAEAIKEPSKVFVGSMMELFGPWVPGYAMGLILGRVRAIPRHTFIFLTKKPENLSRWNAFWHDSGQTA